MLIQTRRDGFNHPTSSDITPASVYQSRRDLIRMMATGVAGAALASWASREGLAQAKGWASPGPEPHLTQYPVKSGWCHESGQGH